MEYKINPFAFSSGIFPVPDVIVDENIRLASVVQLKVILYIMRHAKDNFTKQDISTALSIDVLDVADAMVFWAERGLLIKELDSASEIASSKSPETKENGITQINIKKAEEKPEEIKEKAKKEVSDIPVSRPSHEQVAARCKESEDLVGLFRAAQDVLGRTVGYEGQATLLMMHDSYGLPVEVILMAIEYAVSMKKTGFASIGKIGKAWSENEIYTIEGAEEYISQHNEIDEMWRQLRSLTEINNLYPTEKQRRYLICWIKEYGYDVNIIYQAYEESVNNTGKFSMPYMDKIIRTWHEHGVKKVVDIQKQRDEWEKSRDKRLGKNKKEPKKKKNDVSGDPSYDINLFNQSALDLSFDEQHG